MWELYATLYVVTLFEMHKFWRAKTRKRNRYFYFHLLSGKCWVEPTSKVKQWDSQRGNSSFRISTAQARDRKAYVGVEKSCRSSLRRQKLCIQHLFLKLWKRDMKLSRSLNWSFKWVSHLMLWHINNLLSWHINYKERESHKISSRWNSLSQIPTKNWHDKK